MHFKFDENLDPRWRIPLEKAGYSVSTVTDEFLQGTDDRTLSEICRNSGFSLITADLDFAQILEYPPSDYQGLIVLRHTKPTLSGMLKLIDQLASALERNSPVGQLWIIEPGRIRIHGMGIE